RTSGASGAPPKPGGQGAQKNGVCARQVHSEGMMQVIRLRNFVGVFLFALAIFCASRLYAGTTASISGTVTDPSGAAVAGASVTATNVDTGVATTLTTNGQGFYSFQSLSLGKYTVEVQQTGFKTTRKIDVVLQVNDALVIDFALQVGQKTEKVEVS